MKIDRRLLALLLAVLLTACGANYSNGIRVGTVTKFSHKGLLFKTWEGQLLMGGLRRDGESLTANTFDFSVVDPMVVAQVQAALESGDRVELEYSQWVIAPPTQQETDYRIVAVHPGKP